MANDLIYRYFEKHPMRDSAGRPVPLRRMNITVKEEGPADTPNRNGAAGSAEARGED